MGEEEKNLPDKNFEQKLQKDLEEKDELSSSEALPMVMSGVNKYVDMKNNEIESNERIAVQEIKTEFHKFVAKLVYLTILIGGLIGLSAYDLLTMELVAFIGVAVGIIFNIESIKKFTGK